MIHSNLKASLKKILAPGTARASFAFFVKFVVVLGRTFNYSLRPQTRVGLNCIADGT